MMTGKPAWRFLRPAVRAGLPLAAVAVSATVIFPTASQPQSPPAPNQVAPASPPPRSRPTESTIRLTPPPAQPPPAPAPAPAPPPVPTSAKPTNNAEWMALPVDDLRGLAYAGDLRAMEELARRLVSGIGVPQDMQSGAGWLLRAAEAGSPSAAFNVGVMYERGFVVERDSTKAVEWYRKGVDGNVAVAKHNLALLLRDGKGAPRDGEKAIELLRSAARQGMAGSMFLLGDMYERGDAASRDAALALAWFAVTVEFERQVNRAPDTPMAKIARQRVETLHRVLTPAELERAEKIGQAELQQILAALAPPKADSPAGAPLPPAAGLALPQQPPAGRPAPPPDDDQTIGWPKTAIERVRAVQQVLIDLRRLNGKADGIAGPATRAAIIDFEKSIGLRETGEVSREVYVAALKAIVQHDAVSRSPLPLPPRNEPPKVEQAAPSIDLGKPDTGPAPPTSADIARVMPRTEAPKPDPEAWPATPTEQIRAIQALLGQLKLMRAAPTGTVGPITAAAIREYQRTAGLAQTGEASRELYESLKAARSRIEPQPAVKPD